MCDAFIWRRVGVHPEHFGPVERADIENGDDEAAITCAFAAIGRDSHEMPDTATCLDRLHHRLATCGDAR